MKVRKKKSKYWTDAEIVQQFSKFRSTVNGEPHIPFDKLKEIAFHPKFPPSKLKTLIPFFQTADKAIADHENQNV